MKQSTNKNITNVLSHPTTISSVMHENEIDDCFADEKDTLKSMSSDILLGLNSCTVAPADSSGEESDTSGKPLFYIFIT